MTTTYRTVNIYDPDNVERVISFVIVSQNASGLALRYECTLDSDGRGSVSLPCNYRYEIRRPNSLTHANLPLSIAPISLIDWLGISAHDAIPTALTDLDTSVTGAQLDADHDNIGGITRVGTVETQIASSTAWVPLRLVNSSSGTTDSDGFAMELYNAIAYLWNYEVGSLIIGTNDTETAEFDDDSTAGNTRMLLYDVDSGDLVRVSVGADDSGGTGYKVLRVPN